MYKAHPTYSREVSKLNTYYKKAMVEVTGRVASLADLTTVGAKQMSSTMSQVTYILKDIDVTNRLWATRTIRTAFTDGQTGAGASILQQGLKAESLRGAASAASFSMLATSTINSLIADTYQDLLVATKHTEQAVKDVVREVTADTMRVKGAQQLGRKTMVRGIKKGLTLRGLSRRVKEDGWVGITDAAGRRWNLNTYSDMVVRTKLQQAYVEGVRFESNKRGVDLGIITSHGATDACAAHEGAIVSLSGNTPGYPSYAQLKATGEIFHPNCKHSVNPIRDPATLPEAVKAKAEKATKAAAKTAKTKNYKGLYSPGVYKGVPPKAAAKPRKKKAAATPNSNSGVGMAQTHQEATAWAIDNLNIDNINYKGYAVELANSTNRTLQTLGNRFPEVIKDTKFIGTSQARNAAEYADRLSSRMIIYEKMGYDEVAAAKHAASGLTKRKVSGHTYAESTGSAWGRLEGICFNEKFAKDYKMLSDSVASDVASTWHPVGTENPASVMTHEYGHQVDNYITKNGYRNDVVDTHYRSLSTDDIKTGLSRYGAKNSSEFFAEAFGEYIHNPKPRAIAAKVGADMEAAFKKIRK